MLFDIEALYHCLQTVPDQRSRQGRRYPLTGILLIGVLAKLAGQDSSRAFDHWAHLRKVETSQFEQVLGDFFASSLAEGNRLQRSGIQVCLDGETLRGTIPLGESSGAFAGRLCARSWPKCK